MADFPHEMLTLLSSSFNISYDSAVLRTDMDSGPPKVRAYKCRTMKIYKAQYHACECETMDAFETWWKEETKFGSAWFKWQDPCSLKFIKARFRGEPQWTSEGQLFNNWTLNIEVETWC